MKRYTLILTVGLLLISSVAFSWPAPYAYVEETDSTSDSQYAQYVSLWSDDDVTLMQYLRVWEDEDLIGMDYLFTIRWEEGGDAIYDSIVDSWGDCIELGEEASKVDLSLLPNPFNPSIAISYQLSSPNFVKVRVYDIAGRLVTTLVNDWQEAGTHQTKFDGSNLASGTYFVKLKAGQEEVVRKMLLVK